MRPYRKKRSYGIKRYASQQKRKENLLPLNIDMISDTENVPAYVAAMGIDITDRKNTESRLADSYQELESLYRELVTKEIELRLSLTI